MYFAFIFSEYITITSYEALLKAWEHNFFEVQAESTFLVIYLFNYDSSKPTFFMLNMAVDVLFSTLQVNWNSSFLAKN